MDNTLSLSHFTELYRVFAGLPLTTSGTPAPPWGSSPPNVDALAAIIQEAADEIPVVYQQAYVTPVLGNLNRILRAGMEETVAGAVYDHAPKYGVVAELLRFQIAIADFYNLFLWRVAREQLHIPLQEQLPPLATFAYTADAGPFTLPVDTMMNLTGSRVGVVSMPSAWRSDPFLWLPFAHETGGHDVVHADPDFLQELKTGVLHLFAPAAGSRRAGSLTPEELFGRLWAYWMDEAVADVAALMDVGPTYAINLGALLSAFVDPSSSAPVLRSQSISRPGEALDVHPTDILRMGLAIGVVESLNGLSADTRTAYVDFLTVATRLCAGGATTVKLQGLLTQRGGTGTAVQQELPLPQMLDAARQAGAFIATVPLRALDGRSLQMIEGWDDAAELAAEQIRSSFGAGGSVVGMGDVGRLLAGATLALMDDPAQYPSINARLVEALDALVQLDRTWGKPVPHPLGRLGLTRPAPPVLPAGVQA